MHHHTEQRQSELIELQKLLILRDQLRGLVGSHQGHPQRTPDTMQFQPSGPNRVQPDKRAGKASSPT